MDSLHELVQLKNNHLVLNIQKSNSEPLMLNIKSTETISSQSAIPDLIRHFTLNNYPESLSKLPTEYIFVLRKIDPHEILNLYRNGHFVNCSIPTTKMSNPETNPNPGRHQFGSNKYDQTYQVKEGGRTRSYLTTGQEDFNLASKKIQNGKDLRDIQLLKVGKCDKCQRDLSELPEGIYPTGIPIKVVKKGNVFIFHTIFKYCTMACAFEKLLAALHNKFGNYILEDCIRTLKFMFHLLYPTGQLVSAPDDHLRSANGGPISDEEHSSPDSYFYKTPNIICVPTKQEYGMLIGGLQCTDSS
uniref:A1L transcription factor/late transcription factor VLTF-2 n=1 Tax=Pithovirus LCPAC201 TaxID=2506591 RepID=A0A481Z5J2_9VIRU|nr:MAG: A1L transcription factor/late transcription factor VLTF-2 [Pithovirus LCPAC201]